MTRHDKAMWTITTPTLIALLGGLIAAIWQLITWTLYAQIAVTAVIAWLILAATFTALWGPKRDRKTKIL